MFINQISKEDKIILTQELILSGVSKNTLNKIKPLEEVLQEEIPYNTEASTPLNIGTIDGNSGIIPQIVSIFENFNNDINPLLIKFHLGFIDSTRIILDSKELFFHTEFIQKLDTLLLSENTSSMVYRRLAISTAGPVLDNILNILEKKIDTIIDIQEKCFSIFQDPELMFKYFQRSGKYTTVTLEDINTETKLPPLIFYELIKGEYPELVNYMFEGNWGNSIIALESVLEENELIDKDRILYFCKDRILSLSKYDVPQVFNHAINIYTKSLQDHYINNNIRPASTFNSRFKNKVSFTNNFISTFNKLISSRIKKYIISRINNNPILLSTFLLENQLRIYNTYGFNKVNFNGIRSVIKRNADNPPENIRVLNKPDRQSKLYKSYKEELLPYFNYQKLNTVMETISGNDYSSVLVASASSFRARNELFFWFGIAENIIQKKIDDFEDRSSRSSSSSKSNKTDFFNESLRLHFKILLYNLLQSTIQESNTRAQYNFLNSISGVSNTYSTYSTYGTYNTSSTKDLLVIIDFVLILKEILNEIKESNPHDNSLISFYNVFQDFIKNINKEFQLLPLIEKIRDELFNKESNLNTVEEYIPDKNEQSSYLYRFNKRNTFMIITLLSETHRLINNILNENDPETGLSIMNNLRVIQNSYQSVSYGTWNKNTFNSQVSINTVLVKIVENLNKDLTNFLSFSTYLRDFQQVALTGFFKNIQNELASTKKEIPLVNYQVLSIKTIDKVNIINSTNNILVAALFKKCANKKVLLREQDSIVNYAKNIKKLNEQNVDGLIELLINPISELNIVTSGIPNSSGHIETIPDSTKIVNYSTSTQLPFLFIISNMMDTHLFKEALNTGTLSKSCITLMNNSWERLQNLAPLVNNILAVLAEGTFHSKYNNTKHFPKVIPEYYIEKDTRLPRTGFIDFQEHLNNLNDLERQKYYRDHKDKMLFFKNTQYYQAGTKESFYIKRIRVLEDICPVFRDYFMYLDFRYIIIGVSNNIGLNLNAAYKKENLISRIYSVSLIPVHDFKFNVLINDDEFDTEELFQYKSNTYRTSQINEFKKVSQNSVRDYRFNVLSLIKESYTLFQEHDNYYYKNLGSTLNLLIDNDSIIYADTELTNWLSSSWKELPLLWNLPDYFLKQIKLETLVHVLSWSTIKPKVLSMFFSSQDFERLLSKKFKFKNMLFQEIISLFYNSTMGELLEELPIEFNPTYSKNSDKIFELEIKKNNTTEEGIRNILYNGDDTEVLNSGFRHYLNYYEMLFERYMQAQNLDEDELQSLKKQFLSMFVDLINGGHYGIPAGITLKCFRNNLPDSRQIFIDLFLEPQLNNLVPIELLMDIETEEDDVVDTIESIPQNERSTLS